MLKRSKEKRYRHLSALAVSRDKKDWRDRNDTLTMEKTNTHLPGSNIDRMDDLHQFRRRREEGREVGRHTNNFVRFLR